MHGKWLVCMGLLLSLAACKKYTDCPEGVDRLESFTVEGKDVSIYADGNAYLQKRGLCGEAIPYFDPDFMQLHYHIDSAGVWIRSDEGQLFPTRNRYLDDFESYSNLLDVFATSVQDTDKYWVTFTAQGPDNPEVADYVDLRKCIMAGTCSFTDNEMALVADPGNADNHVLRFTAVKPSRGMVTSKMSFDSPLPYFVLGTDCWFQADFKIEGDYPYSLVDLENPYFEGSPGPRIVIMNGALAWENKFGAKDKVLQTNPVALPQNQWFTLKVHMFFTNTTQGQVEIWQDGALVLRASGKTLPTYHSVQSSLEVGISSTDVATSLLLDNVRVSDIAF